LHEVTSSAAIKRLSSVPAASGHLQPLPAGVVHTREYATRR
jgi:hypothetical protein